MFTPSELLKDNRFSDAAITATSTAAGTDAANLVDWRTNTVWTSADTADQYLTVDSGVAKAVDGFGLIGNLAALGASVALECSDDNFVADITIASAAAVVTQAVVFLPFTAVNKKQTRLAITGLTAPCTLSLLVAGQRFVFDQGIEGSFTPAVERVFPRNRIPARGQGLEILPAYVGLSSRVDFHLTDDVWFRDTFIPLWDNWLMPSMPFFWAPNRTLCPDDVYLYRVKPGSSLDAYYQTSTSRGFSLQLEGLHHDY